MKCKKLSKIDHVYYIANCAQTYFSAFFLIAAKTNISLF
jgi:hypothetical protein